MLMFRLLGVCLLAVLLWPGSAWALEVRFEESATIQGEMLTLGEVATLSPETARRRHADTPLFQAPREGKVKVYSASTIKAYVREALSGQGDIDWAGADRVTVRREGRLIQGREVAEMVQEYLRDKEDELPVDSLAFEPGGLPDPFTVPRGDLEHEVIPSNDQVIGSRYFTVRFRVDGKLAGNVTLRGELEATAPVVVASRDLERDTVLGPDDLKIAKRDVTRAREPLMSRERAAGMRLKRSLDSGDVLERGRLDRPVLVDRGEVVTMEAKKGRLLLTAKGVASSKGKKGETIKVTNTNSQREVLCKVVDSGRVRVEF